MEFKEIATVAGKPGLYKVVKPSRNGVILESLDEKKAKLVVGGNQRVSLLNEISVYTMTEDGATPLEDVMKKIEQEFEGDTGLEGADNEEYKAFLKHVLPEYDEERVYVSDIKKMINWYHILRNQAPLVLQETQQKKDEKKKPKDEEE